MARSLSDGDPEQILAHDAFVRGLARQLLRDRHGAEDIAQQTWVAALKRPAAAGEPANLRAWLAAVVRRLAGRRLRDRRRAAAREQAAARGERVPPAAEIVAREQQRAEIVRAVLELEPLYRDVVLLRFFEHLPPRAVARRLQVPVETVRTRQKRAFALLRQQLDARHGGNRAAWCAMVLPLAGPLSPLPAACAAVKSMLLGVLLMTSQTKITAAAAALAGILIVALWVAFAPAHVSGLAAPPAADNPAAITVAAAAAAERAAEARAGTPGAMDRQPLAPEAPEDTGSLAVRVVFEDGTPAADVQVVVWRSGADPLFEQPRLVTDAAGKARFDQLRPGRVYPQTWRGSNSHGKVTEIVAGRTADAELRLEPGMDVHGRVVDARRLPIAGAEVIACDWGGGEAHVLAHSGADGTFALRAVETHCHIGARAQGYAASLLRQFTAGKGAQVELEIVLDEPGVALLGKVVDPQGRPVAGAVARAGSDQQKMQTLPDGGQAMGWRPEMVRSDEQGRFEFHYLPAGKLPLAVRAQGLAPWHGDVDLVAGRTASISVCLEAGVTLVGTVRDENGQPVAKVDIQAGEWRDLGHRQVSSAADGAFRIEGLPVGELALTARSDEHGDAKTTIQAIAGQTVTWNVVLDPGLTVRGRVVDADDKPLAGVMVESRMEQPRAGDRWGGFANSGADGRFALKNCPPGRTVSLMVRRQSTFPELTVTGVKPGGEEVVVRLPKEAWVYIEGSITDPDGKALPNVHASPFMKGGNNSPAETADPATGTFRYGPFPPGEYTLALQAEGYPPIRLPWRTLVGNEVWDTGALRFERGGSLVFAAIGEAAVAEHASFHVCDAEGASAGRIQVQDGIGRLGPLRAGDYRLMVGGKSVAASVVPFTVRVGAETRLDVPLRQGVAAAVECQLPEGTEPAPIELEIADGAGALVARLPLFPQKVPARAELALSPGSYRVSARMGPFRGTAALEVKDGGGPVTAVVVLRRE